MSMRRATRNPMVITGTNISGAGINTGQMQHTLGGANTFSLYSGTAGGDANIWVGAGRLDMVNIWNGTLLALSGTPLIFYDSAVAVSGGPLATSGHKVVGAVGPGTWSYGNASGDVIGPGMTVQLGFPFYSGLCYTSRSGHLAWTATYTPVVSGGSQLT